MIQSGRSSLPDNSRSTVILGITVVMDTLDLVFCQCFDRPWVLTAGLGLTAVMAGLAYFMPGLGLSLAMTGMAFSMLFGLLLASFFPSWRDINNQNISSKDLSNNFVFNVATYVLVALCWVLPMLVTMTPVMAQSLMVVSCVLPLFSRLAVLAYYNQMPNSQVMMLAFAAVTLAVCVMALSVMPSVLAGHVVTLGLPAAMGLGMVGAIKHLHPENAQTMTSSDWWVFVLALLCAALTSTGVLMVSATILTQTQIMAIGLTATLCLPSMVAYCTWPVEEVQNAGVGSGASGVNGESENVGLGSRTAPFQLFAGRVTQAALGGGFTERARDDDKDLESI